MIFAALLSGALLTAACGSKQQASETNVNENPTEQKTEVKEVEGRKNFAGQAVITPLPAIMIATSRRDDGCMGRTVRTQAHLL